MRFIAKVLKDSLHDKFPDAGEDELLKVRIYVYTFVNNCQPDGLWKSTSQSSLLLAVCVESSTCKPVHLPLRIENISHQAIAVSFIHIT